MILDHFTSRFLGVLMNDNEDHYYSALRTVTRGLTSYRTAKLLNFATSLLDKSECYLEVGVFTGFTLLSAHYANAKQCIGIDNFNPTAIFTVDPKDLKNELAYNISRYSKSVGDDIYVLEADFKDVTADKIPKPVGVFFVDGGHSYEDTMAQVDWGTPFLAKEAVIVMDDATFPSVSKAITEIANRPGHDLLFLAKPYYCGEGYYPDRDRVLNTGLAVFGYKKP